MKTLKGSPIRRYLNKVGKKMGDRLYVHWLYAEQIIPNKPLLNATNKLIELNYHRFSCLMYDFNTGEIRFDEAPDFDTADEPKVGAYICVSPDGDARQGYSEAIWHHKWLWVMDDYEGFDVAAAKARSAWWLSKLNEPAKGSMKSWQKQLSKIS